MPDHNFIPDDDDDDDVGWEDIPALPVIRPASIFYICSTSMEYFLIVGLKSEENE
jgi:hypothetical protein